MNLPNMLTMLRLLLIPFFVCAFYFPIEGAKQVAAMIFLIAAATDHLDGYLARKWDQSTKFGAFLDPVADKAIVSIALILLVSHSHHIIMTLPAAIIICREIVVSALREWMAEVGKREEVAVSKLGKQKTSLQLIAIFCLLFAIDVAGPGFSWLQGFGYLLLYLAVGLTVWSMVNYLRLAWPEMKASMN